MSAATKTSTALITLLVGVMVVYYTWFLPDGTDDPLAVASGEDAPLATSADTDDAARAALDPDPTAAELEAERSSFRSAARSGADRPRHTDVPQRDPAEPESESAPDPDPAAADLRASVPPPLGSVPIADRGATSAPADGHALSLADADIAGDPHAVEQPDPAESPAETPEPGAAADAAGDAASPAPAADSPRANTPATVAAADPAAEAPQRRPARPAASSAPDAPRPPKYTTYTIESGDTFSSIAAEWFGDASKWDLIARANPYIDPNKLAIGQEIRLPPRDARPEPITAGKNDDAMHYVVRSGDTLSKIARAYYSDVGMWKVIFDANRETLRNDPDRLRVGMKLRIPPAPRRASARAD